MLEENFQIITCETKYQLQRNLTGDNSISFQQSFAAFQRSRTGYLPFMIKLAGSSLQIVYSLGYICLASAASKLGTYWFSLIL